MDNVVSKHALDMSMACQNANTSEYLGLSWLTAYLNYSIDMFLGPSIRTLRKPPWAGQGVGGGRNAFMFHKKKGDFPEQEHGELCQGSSKGKKKQTSKNVFLEC